MKAIHALDRVDCSEKSSVSSNPSASSPNKSSSEKSKSESSSSEKSKSEESSSENAPPRMQSVAYDADADADADADTDDDSVDDNIVDDEVAGIIERCILPNTFPFLLSLPLPLPGMLLNPRPLLSPLIRIARSCFDSINLFIAWL